jgi:hypothetical protein
MKSFLNPPDIAYDGIVDPERVERDICIQEGDEVLLINLDAANDFEKLKKDAHQFNCEGVKISFR